LDGETIFCLYHKMSKRQTASLKKAILVGSRAAALYFDAEKPRLPHREARDWDFSGPMGSFTSFATEKIKNIVSIEEIRLDKTNTQCAEKYRLRFRNGALVEWEIAEFFKSATALEKSCSFLGGRGNSDVVGALALGTLPRLKTRVPNFEAASMEIICLMKLSHLFWPTSWRKTAEDLAQYSKVIPYALSPKQLIQKALASEKNQMQLFYDFRLREAAFRRNLEQGNVAIIPVLTAEVEARFSQMKGSGALLPSELSFLAELVRETAEHRFLLPLLHRSDPILSSWMSDPSLTLKGLVEDLWSLGLETVCTNGLAKPAPRTASRVDHVHAESNLIRAIYDILEPVEVQEKYLSLMKPMTDSSSKLHQMASLTLPNKINSSMMSSEDVERAFPHITSAIVSRIIEGIPLLLNPPESFKRMGMCFLFQFTHPLLIACSFSSGSQLCRQVPAASNPTR
jgi:hypothetical protein